MTVNQYLTQLNVILSLLLINEWFFLVDSEKKNRKEKSFFYLKSSKLLYVSFREFEGRLRFSDYNSNCQEELVNCKCKDGAQVATFSAHFVWTLQRRGSQAKGVYHIDWKGTIIVLYTSQKDWLLIKQQEPWAPFFEAEHLLLGQKRTSREAVVVVTSLRRINCVQKTCWWEGKLIECFRFALWYYIHASPPMDCPRLGNAQREGSLSLWRQFTVHAGDQLISPCLQSSLLQSR